MAGSDTIDFLTAKPTDHNVETLYLEGIDDFQSQFDSWYNFGGKQKKRSKCTSQSESVEQPSDSQTRAFGVLMILEAENILIPLASDSVNSIKTALGATLNNVGLFALDSTSFSSSENGIESSSIILFLKEGYIAARCIPVLQYCAFDIQLYGEAIEKLPVVQAELLAAVQSQKSSSYRFVTGGMFGRQANAGPEVPKKIGPPSLQEMCKIKSLSGEAGEQVDGTEVRKEKRKGEFGEPKASTLHSYDFRGPLAQWQSQKQAGTQLLLKLELPSFWPGEKVLVKVPQGSQSSWLPGTVAKYQGEGRYGIFYDEAPDNERKAHEADIKRRSGKVVDKKMVVDVMTQLNDLLLAGADDVAIDSYEKRRIVDDYGDGVMIALVWTGGTLVATWDGRSSLMVNMFFYDVGINAASLSAKMESAQDNGILQFLSILQDDFPRGTGNNVNYNIERPIWA